MKSTLMMALTLVLIAVAIVLPWLTLATIMFYVLGAQ